MKKVFGAALIMLLTAGISMPSFAKTHKDEKFERIIARVVSVDASANTMVIKGKNGESKTIKISAKAASQVKSGDRVRIKLKTGTDESLGVRVLKDESKTEVPAAAPVAETEKKM